MTTKEMLTFWLIFSALGLGTAVATRMVIEHLL
jgi:hypothetical protein